VKDKIGNIDRLFLFFDYIGPFSLLSAGRRHIKFMKYHFEQGLSFFFMELFIFIIVDIILAISGFARHMFYAASVFIVLSPINIVAIIRSLQNVYFKIPIIGWERKRLEEYLGIDSIRGIKNT
jgi:uncharacterized membrane protein